MFITFGVTYYITKGIITVRAALIALCNNAKYDKLIVPSQKYFIDEYVLIPFWGSGRQKRSRKITLSCFLNAKNDRYHTHYLILNAFLHLASHSMSNVITSNVINLFFYTKAKIRLKIIIFRSLNLVLGDRAGEGK